MKKVIVATDCHWGLMTDELNRDDEITEVMSYIFKYAVKVKADYIVLNGDQFHKNTPSERLIALFISVLNIANKAGITVFVVVGNHEVIAKHKRKSCLSFIKKLKVSGYPNVTLVDDVKTVKLGPNAHATFFPFITKAHIPAEFKTVQEYVDAKAEALLKKLCILKHWPHYVFSHLNVPDCIPGTEENMLKKVEVMLPDSLRPTYLDKPDIIVINGHIHTRQQIKNVHIVGSPIFVGFGEKEEKKYFLEIHVPTEKDDRNAMIWHETPCKRLLEFNTALDKLSDSEKFMVAVEKELMTDKELKNTILKVNLELNENAIGFDHERLRSRLSGLCHFVKPIQPKIIRTHVKRNREQTAKLDPKDAVKLWLKTHKHPKAKTISEIAKGYIDNDGGGE